MNNTEFSNIISAAGLNPPLKSDLEIVGDDPILQSPLRIGSAISAAIGMLACVANEIWEMRTGRRQKILINMEHAAISICSLWLIKINGENALEKLDGKPSPADGAYKCADNRWIRLLSSFSHLREETLKVLKCENSPESISIAVLKKPAFDWENELIEKNLPGSVVRPYSEWLKHPQYLAMKDLPVVCIEKNGDSSPYRFAEGPMPLSGIKILDMTRVLAGPSMSSVLASMGAEVTRIGFENIPDLISARLDTGLGKQRIDLNLTDKTDLEILRQLILQSDVFIQSDRQGSMDKKGLSVNEIAKINPGIIYVSVSCYGHVGPWSFRRGFDSNVQAATGIHDLKGGPERIINGGIAMGMNDYGTGYWGAFGILNALLNRAKSGGSWHIRVSLAQTANWFLKLGAPYLNSSDKLESPNHLYTKYSEKFTCKFGQLEHLKPIIQLSETPLKWESNCKI